MFGLRPLTGVEKRFTKGVAWLEAPAIGTAPSPNSTLVLEAGNTVAVPAGAKFFIEEIFAILDFQVIS